MKPFTVWTGKYKIAHRGCNSYLKLIIAVKGCRRLYRSSNLIYGGWKPEMITDGSERRLRISWDHYVSTTSSRNREMHNSDIINYYVV